MLIIERIQLANATTNYQTRLHMALTAADETTRGRKVPTGTDK